MLTHVGRPDEQLHGLGRSEVLLIVAGPHGYVSPSWYSDQATPAPTWNFSVAHCYGTPQVLDPDENLAVLTRLVDPDVGARLALGTVGVRLPIDRFVCKVKMSQDKDEQSRRQVLAALKGDGPYASPALAADMQRTPEEGADATDRTVPTTQSLDPPAERN